MTTYYVNPQTGGGSPGGSGTAASPWNGFGNVNWTTVGGGGNELTGSDQTFDESLTPPVAANGVSGDPTIIRNMRIEMSSASTNIFLPPREYITFQNIVCSGASGATRGLGISSVDGNAPVGVSFVDCDFSDHTGDDGVRWLVSATGAVATLTDFTFTRCTAHRNAETGFHFRIENDAGVGVGIDGLTFTDCQADDNDKFGFRILGELEDPSPADPTSTSLQSRSTDFSFLRNRASGNGSGDAGGGMALGGFDGDVEVASSTSSSNNGPAGGINCFHFDGARVHGNTCNSNTSTTIDANGILMDHENINCRVWNNECSYNSLDIADNAGYGIMVLDCSSLVVEGNYGVGNRGAFYFGGVGIDQADVTVRNNTFVQCTDRAVTVAAAWDVNGALTLQNNIMSGSGDAAFVEDGGIGTYTEDYNVVHGFTAPGITLGGNDLTDDPLVQSDFALASGSPARSVGTWIAGARAYDDLPLPPTPDIGAVQDRGSRSVGGGAGDTIFADAT